MEVVCLILGPMLVSRTCSHAFWVLTSLHLSFLFKMFFIILTTYIESVLTCLHARVKYQNSEDVDLITQALKFLLLMDG